MVSAQRSNTKREIYPPLIELTNICNDKGYEVVLIREKRGIAAKFISTENL